MKTFLFIIICLAGLWLVGLVISTLAEMGTGSDEESVGNNDDRGANLFWGWVAFILAVAIFALGWVAYFTPSATATWRTVYAVIFWVAFGLTVILVFARIAFEQRMWVLDGEKSPAARVAGRRSVLAIAGRFVLLAVLLAVELLGWLCAGGLFSVFCYALALLIVGLILRGRFNEPLVPEGTGATILYKADGTPKDGIQIVDHETFAQHRFLLRAAIAVTLLAIIGLIGHSLMAVSVAGVDKVADEVADEVATVNDGNAVDLDDLDDARTELTVDLDALQVEQWDSVSYVLLEYSLSAYDRERTQATGFSDAVSIPFASSDEDGVRAELAEEILRNPVYGVGMAEFLSDIRLGDQTLGELNPWMDEFVQLTDENSLNYWCVYATDGETILVSDEYRTYAVGICTLFERCVYEGAGVYQTSVNWCMNTTQRNSERRMAPASYEYSGEFFTFAYVAKSGDTLLEIGVNSTDKRPALFKEVTAEKTTSTPSSSGSTPSSGTPSTPSAPTTPDEPSGNGGGDTPTVTPKDPTADPVNNGNANTGGGQNDTTEAGEQETEHSAKATGSSAVTTSSTSSSSSSGSSATAGSSTTGTGSSSAPVTDPITKTDSTSGVDNATGETGDLATSENSVTLDLPD